ERVDVLLDGRVLTEAGHALLEAAVGDGADELFLRQRLEAVEQRGADHAFLVGAVAAVAGRGAPGVEALEREGVDLGAVHDLVRRGAGGGGGRRRGRGALALRR